MRPLVAGLERLTERLGRQADLTARLAQSLARGAAGIGEAALASTCVHLLVVGRPGVVQVLQDVDAGRVFYGRSRPGQILHIDVFHADGEVDHRLVARQLARAARIFARDAGTYRMAGLPVEQIPDYVDLQTGTGGGRASGSLIYGRRLSLRLAHRNHVHLAVGLPRALWGFAVYAVAAAEEAILAAGLELRRIEAVERVCGRGGAPLDLSDYETSSDSFLREEGRQRPGGGGWPWAGPGDARFAPGRPAGSPGAAGTPGAGGDGEGPGAPAGGGAGEGVLVRGPAPGWETGGGLPPRAGAGRGPGEASGPTGWREVPVDGDGADGPGTGRGRTGAGPSGGIRRDGAAGRAPWRSWWGAGRWAGASPGDVPPAVWPPGGAGPGGEGGTGTAGDGLSGTADRGSPGRDAGSSVAGAGGAGPGLTGPGGIPLLRAEAARQQLLARSLDWLRETGVDLGTALLERLGQGAGLRDLQLPGASYEDLRRWLVALREAGLLEREGERYRLSRLGRELLLFLMDEPAAVRTALRRMLRVRPVQHDPRPGHGQVAVYDDERGRQANRRGVRPWAPGTGGDGLAVAETVLAALARGGLPLRVEVRDLRLYRRLRRHPVDVCLVLDASASMAGSRIRAAKDLAQQLLVSTRDRVAVITFQERVVQVQVPLTRNTTRVERGLSQIQPYGLTPLAQGLEAALAYLAQSRARNPLLVLITDGIPTVPYRTANPLDDAIQVARQLGEGRFGRIGFTCIGLQPNERYLRALVRAAGGRLYVVDELERDTLVSIVHRERAQRKERARP